MSDPRELAGLALACQVNDWIETAHTNARNVIALCDAADQTERDHNAEAASLRAEVAALTARAHEAAAVAEKEATDRVRAQIENEQLKTRIRDLEQAGFHLNERIVERSDNTFVFSYGSRPAVDSFRKALGA